jgi:hypothetical protein
MSHSSGHLVDQRIGVAGAATRCAKISGEISSGQDDTWALAGL